MVLTVRYCRSVARSVPRLVGRQFFTIFLDYSQVQLVFA
jgi:hypothetical protein